MPDQQGNPCITHDPPLTLWQRIQGKKRTWVTCACDEERDRAAGLHRASDLDDGFGGYLCICRGGRYSVRYGCVAKGYAVED